MRFFPRPRVAIACDTAAIVVFAVVGLLSHDGTVTGRGLARDALPLLGGWFALALLVRLYARPARWRLAATWLIGITAGVAVRAAILDHAHVGKEAAFLAVTLSFALLFVLAARVLTAWALPRSRRPAHPRASS
ncbi:MAG TPA: DUF3054 domain-containing protein [Gaiellaceae bacterium]|jgi:peptidoglycan/LPS O-acetylase OafA/YrhL|nr:DUF3054 domain-containing protein [Gaiellaceae bacterium]